MRRRDIARAAWSSFLDDFSRDHAGCVCTLEVRRPGQRREVVALGWPLVGVTLEERQETSSVQVFVGDTRDRHIGHTLDRPLRIRVEETVEGARTGLAIEGAGAVLELRFHAPQAPDYVEGYLP